MRTLIVLCAGEKTLDNVPVYLNRHPDGKLLAEKSIEGIYADSYDALIFTILKEHEEKYKSSEILNAELGKKFNIKIVILDKQTQGPAESVYLTIKKLGLDGEFAVRDSLNCIKLKDKVMGNCVVGLDLTQYTGDVPNVRNKSFIVRNEQKQILDIIEKRFRSDIISVGLYSFKSVSDFLLAFKNLNDVNYPISKLYLSNIISYLIGYKQRMFSCMETIFYEDWATTEAWNKLQRKYKVLVIDIDSIINKRYEDKFVDELILRLKGLSGTNMSSVFITHATQINKDALLVELNANDIKCFDIISGMPYSKEYFMVNSLTDFLHSIQDI